MSKNKSGNKKPIDPRNCGLKAPVERLLKYEDIKLDHYYGEGSIKMQALVSAWTKLFKTHELNGDVIESEPEIEFRSSDCSYHITYSYSTINPNYQAEKEHFNIQVRVYETEKALYLIDEKAYETAQIDKQVKNLEERLARLKAGRDSV